MSRAADRACAPLSPLPAPEPPAHVSPSPQEDLDIALNEIKEMMNEYRREMNEHMEALRSGPMEVAALRNELKALRVRSGLLMQAVIAMGRSSLHTPAPGPELHGSTSFRGFQPPPPPPSYRAAGGGAGTSSGSRTPASKTPAGSRRPSFSHEKEGGAPGAVGPGAGPAGGDHEPVSPSASRSVTDVAASGGGASVASPASAGGSTAGDSPAQHRDHAAAAAAASTVTVAVAGAPGRAPAAAAAEQLSQLGTI